MAGQGPRPDRGAGANAAPRLRPLNQPRPIAVETNKDGTPTAVAISKVRRAVEAVIESWRIDDEWWRASPVSRIYWRLMLEDGRSVDVYRDRVRDKWFRQAYA
jgi:hypothetical protein